MGLQQTREVRGDSAYASPSPKVLPEGTLALSLSLPYLLDARSAISMMAIGADHQGVHSPLTSSLQRLISTVLPAST